MDSPKKKECSTVQFSAFRFVSPHLAHNEGANLLVGVSGNNKGLCVDLPVVPGRYQGTGTSAPGGKPTPEKRRRRRPSSQRIRAEFYFLGMNGEGFWITQTKRNPNSLQSETVYNHSQKIFVIEGNCGTQILTKCPRCTFSNMAWWVALCTLV